MGRRIGSLFSGAGGLDLAVLEVFNGEVVWHAEIDKAASKVLAHRFPGVPNLGDISAVDWADVPAVDVLCGGFPCQDVSAAGKRAGIKAGTRSGLWSVFADAIDELRPQWVVIENVRGLLSATAHRTVDDADSDVEPAAGAVGDGAGRPVLRAAGAVLGDLADLRYDAQWATVAAADVGAPHRRERVFILATHTAIGSRDGLQQQDLSALQQRRGDRRPGQSGVCDCGDSACVADVADSPRNRRDKGRPEPAGIVGGFDAAVSGVESGVALLPTPCVVDRLATTDMTLEQWDESRRSQKERGVGSFGPRGDSLGAAILRVEEGSERPDYSTTKSRRGGDESGVALLPTPNASDGSGGGQHPDKREGHSRQLIDYVLLCTPSAADGAQHGDGDMDDLRTTVSLLPTPKAHDGEFGTPRTTGRPIEKSTHLGTIASLEQTSHWGKYAPAIRRWEAIVGPAPAPTEPNKNGNPRLSAAFSEWLMGWPQGWVTHPDIGISRNDQLRIIGNGVCPQQATAALRFLLAVATGTHTHTLGRADMTPKLPTPCARDHKDGDSAGVHARNTPSLGAVSAYFGVGE